MLPLLFFSILGACIGVSLAFVIALTIAAE
jgi:hypothetical protein